MRAADLLCASLLLKKKDVISTHSNRFSSYCAVSLYVFLLFWLLCDVLLFSCQWCNQIIPLRAEKYCKI